MDIATLDPTDLGKEQFCDALFDYYRLHGHEKYDEVVSQLEHALQAATLAEQQGHSSALQIAALFHDIGHIAENDEESRVTDLRHQITGAQLLRGWFDDSVAEPVLLHVDAKRYLVAVEPSYADNLSPASVRSLELQGGPMNAEEVAEFERNAAHQDAVALRRLDDGAKDPHAQTPDLDHWRTAVCELLV